MTEQHGARSAAENLADLIPRLGRIISSALETTPGGVLSLRQYRILERLAARSHRTGELASSSGVSQATASAAVSSLEARALVVRTTDAADQRATCISLTSDGRRALDQARRQILERLSIVTAEVTAEDAEALARLCPVLVNGMDRLREVSQRRGAKLSRL